MQQRNDIFIRQKPVQKQTHQLSPVMQRSLQLLEFPYHELRDFLGKAALENPFLSFPGGDDPVGLFPQDFYERKGGQRIRDFSDPASYAGTQDTMSSLHETLRLQMLGSFAPSDVMQAGLFIIEHIDRRGYCSLSLSEMAQVSSFPEVLLKEALSQIRTFHPMGVGAFTLQECLQMQMDPARTDYDKAILLLNLPAETLGRRNLTELSRQCHTDIKTIRGILQYLATLDPAPGLACADPTPANYIFPEITVLSQGNHLEMFLCDGTRLISLEKDYYQELVSSGALDGEAKDYVSLKYTAAKALADSLSMRQKILEQLLQFLLTAQSDYFTDIHGELKPITMRQAAQALHVHSSTVSRCINDKYIQTNRGVIPLRDLFSEALPADQAGEVSPDTVKQLIQKEIRSENPSAPLDDMKLAQILQNNGVRISRRTVAKYRQQLGIAGSRERMMKGREYNEYV